MLLDVCFSEAKMISYSGVEQIVLIECCDPIQSSC